MLEFLKQIILFLQKNNIDYMLSGSVALSAYTLPRATRDFDFIIRIKIEDVKFFLDNFKEGYYCDKEAIEDAIKNQSMFNIIDYASGFKADFIILKNENFRQIEFERRKEIELFNMKMFIVSAEDLIISKLAWIQNFQSNLQIEDIKNLLQVENIELDYIQYWCKELKLNTFNLL
jgi:hypothetical protein